ncbi:hypothetical protein ACFOZ0_10215 [Streptomyces yaanensis]|uniref:Uncharacterized protein n=1 Tax=Streptomyces yaanensis TaxID=1142239 RepID=A0ABV7SBF1_9ACTN|nr:hypothetical protein [Streptomyces sp. CGMCC 4.7035]WNB96723.1 hypothetical protein Q2K21_00805 [Streptomyces sp. CGMCC 4.7035]
MSELLSSNIRKVSFWLWAVLVGLVLVVPRVVCEGALEVRAMNAELSEDDRHVRRGAVLG